MKKKEKENTGSSFLSFSLLLFLNLSRSLIMLVASSYTPLSYCPVVPLLAGFGDIFVPSHPSLCQILIMMANF